MVVLRHQRLLLGPYVVEVYNHKMNPIAELWIQPYKTLGLT